MEKNVSGSLPHVTHMESVPDGLKVQMWVINYQTLQRKTPSCL